MPCFMISLAKEYWLGNDLAVRPLPAGAVKEGVLALSP
jgi:hypothetical protein